MGILPPATVVPAGIVISNGCVSLKSAPAWRGKMVQSESLFYMEQLTRSVIYEEQVFVYHESGAVV